MNSEKIKIGKNPMNCASKLKAAPLSAGDVDLKANGACSMTLEGKAEKLSAELLGAGNLKAAALPVKSAIVSVTGTGSAEVNATSDLNASITGAGSIKYKGSPRITKQILGVGSIAKF